MRPSQSRAEGSAPLEIVERTGPGPGATEGPAPPAQPLHHLDALWVQVAGTLCNQRCAHCFVSAGPGERRHDLMSRGEVAKVVREAVDLGVQELYFTGGEPFVHPELLEILADSLPFAPCTVLTNGTLIDGRRARRLAELGREARYSLEIRISLDGVDRTRHEAVRGPGSFARALEGLRRSTEAGLLPIVTFTQPLDEDSAGYAERCRAMLSGYGFIDARIKLLPWFRLGREADRQGPYAAFERLDGVREDALAEARLPCGSGRAVSSRGIYVCPLLVDEPGGRLGDRLADALRPVSLVHGACTTCWITGSTCTNA